MDFTSELIAYTLALPIITFLLGVMYGGSEARAELKAQKNPHEQGTLDHWRFEERKAQDRKNA